MAARIRKDDRVVVIAGKDKGKEGKVLRVIPDKDRVVVEGVNIVHRHLRPSRQNPQGGRVRKEMPVHMSNVMPIDPTTGKGTRVRFVIKRDKSGDVVSKQRTSVGGTLLSEVTRAESKRGKAEA